MSGVNTISFGLPGSAGSAGEADSRLSEEMRPVVWSSSWS